MRKENYWGPEGENDNVAELERQIDREAITALVVVLVAAALVIGLAPYLYMWLARESL